MPLITFTPIVLEPTQGKKSGRDVFRVVEHIEVRLNGAYLTIIESGFESDGASLPWFVRFKWSSWGKYGGPALLHDHLLTTTNRPKWEVDVLFYLALRANGVSALEAMIFYLAVRLKRGRD